MFRFVSHHNHAVAGNLQQGNNSHIEEAKITKTVAIVVLGFVCCCAPATTIHFVSVFGGYNRKESSMPAYAFLIQTPCTFLTSCIKPFIYGFTNRGFRKEYLELLRSLLPLGAQVAPAGAPRKTPNFWVGLLAKAVIG